MPQKCTRSDANVGYPQSLSCLGYTGSSAAWREGASSLPGVAGPGIITIRALHDGNLIEISPCLVQIRQSVPVDWMQCCKERSVSGDAPRESALSTR